MELHTVFFRGNYRRNEAGNIFLLAFSVSKSIDNNIFLLPTDLPTDKKLSMKDSHTEHFRGDFVDKLITNGMVAQIPMKNSVGKSKDCGSGNGFLETTF